MIVECVGSYRCMNGRYLYLIYDNIQERKFAPQKSFDKEELVKFINCAVDQLGHVTVYDYCGKHKKELYE